MKLSKLRIENFRSFKDETIYFDDYTCLVGANGTGKLLLAILINLDLPWNPTRLEQRKGQIQRIGQVRDTVHICNLRY